MTTPTGKLLATLLLMVATFAWVVRFWLVSPHPWGPALGPAPDALEYAASAQALALEGRYVLHVGPHEVPPRFPPGWSMILALAIKAGLPTERLWYVASLFAVLHSVVLAAAAFMASRACVRERGNGLEVGSFLAGLTAGIGWAVTPVSIGWARFVMSDEAAAFFMNAALLLLAIGLHYDALGSTAQKPVLVTAGALAGCSVAMRTISAVLLALPVAGLVGLAVRRLGVKGAGTRFAAATFGFFIPVAACAGVLWRSGRPVHSWSAYSFWLPELFGSLSNVFHMRFATAGNPEFAAHTQGALGHAEIAARFFLGVPIAGQWGLGYLWPSVAWLGGTVVLAYGAFKLHAPVAQAVGCIVASMVLGHIALFSFYFFPGTRFHLSAAAWAWVLIALTFGVLWKSSRLPSSLVLLLAWLAVCMTALTAFRPFIAAAEPSAVEAARRRPFIQWWRQPAAERVRRGFPQDPLESQALGLLTPEVLNVLGTSPSNWGALPSTEHVERLRMKGFQIETVPQPMP